MVSGFCINYHSDHVLRTLRKPGETGYKIPMGGVFRFVSGANFFGEIVEWSGYAIATGLAFGLPLHEAVVQARAYVRKAIETAPGFGHGHGPLNHAHTVRQS